MASQGLVLALPLAAGSNHGHWNSWDCRVATTVRRRGCDVYLHACAGGADNIIIGGRVWGSVVDTPE